MWFTTIIFDFEFQYKDIFPLKSAQCFIRGSYAKLQDFRLTLLNIDRYKLKIYLIFISRHTVELMTNLNDVAYKFSFNGVV